MANPMEDEECRRARETMVRYQIEARGIDDRNVLLQMRAIPRHLFIPQELRRASYQDRPLPIGEGQTISQPYIVAFMTSLLALKPTDTVLEIGTGSGYQAAILAGIVRRVISVERLPEIARKAEFLLKSLGIHNVRFVTGDGTLGYPDEGPYDGIIVTAASPDVPEPLKAQLAEGGRLVIPVGTRDLQQLVRVTRKGTVYPQEIFGGVVFVPLLGRFGWKV